MVNPTDVIAVLGAAKAAFDTTKAGIEALKGLVGPKDNPEIKAKLIELKDHLLDAQDKVLGLREAMQALKEEKLALVEEVDRLKRENQALAKPTGPDWKSKLVFGSEGITFSESVSGYSPGPFCKTCYSITGKLVELKEMPAMMQDFGKYHCVECDAKQSSRGRR